MPPLLVSPDADAPHIQSIQAQPQRACLACEVGSPDADVLNVWKALSPASGQLVGQVGSL